jgi:hypothetical protein
VVADEVRSLAQRTQQSTEEIEELIAGLQSGTQRVASVMDNSRSLTDSSVELTRRAGGSLETITRTVSSIQAMNQQIATAAEQQSAVAEEINRSVMNVRDISDQTSAASEETASSSVELARLGTHLQGLVAGSGCNARRGRPGAAAHLMRGKFPTPFAGTVLRLPADEQDVHAPRHAGRPHRRRLTMLGPLNRMLGHLSVRLKLAMGFALVLLLTLATTLRLAALDGAIVRSEQLTEIALLNDLAKDLRAERITYRVLSDDTSRRASPASRPARKPADHVAASQQHR